LRLPVLAETSTEKQRLCSYSEAHGLGLSVAYPTAVDEIPEIRAVVNGQQFPSAKRVAANLLTVPTHQWLTDKDKSAIASLWRDTRSA
jgi:dTDP-4-amino-4,6-dideoxygalactose transaminase